MPKIKPTEEFIATARVIAICILFVLFTVYLFAQVLF